MKGNKATNDYPVNETTAVQERNPGRHIATTNFPIKEATAVTNVGNLEPSLAGNNKKKSLQVATMAEIEKQESRDNNPNTLEAEPANDPDVMTSVTSIKNIDTSGNTSDIIQSIEVKENMIHFETKEAAMKSNMIQVVNESDGETSFDRFCRAKSFFASDVTDKEIKCGVKEKLKLPDDLEYTKKLLSYLNDQKTQKKYNDDEVLPDNKSKSCGHSNKQNPKQVDTVKIKPRRLTLDSVFGAAWKAMKPSDRNDSKKILAKPTCQRVGEIQQVNQQSGEILVMKLINMLSVDDKEVKEKNCVEALPILTDLLQIVRRY